VNRPPRSTDQGWSLIELVVVLALAGSLFAITAPLTRTAIDAGRARHAAGFVASRFRQARHGAIARSASEAVVFDLVEGRWQLRVCLDGNGNGVRRADLPDIDECVDGPHDIGALYPQMQLAIDASTPDPSGQAGNEDPVRFGVSDIASFTPAGTATAGTVYLRSAQDVQYAVRVQGINGRTRILRFDPVAGVWREI
jgi:prepilin-type N-terminal cleavage/methylation domain-containing protein